MCYSGNYKCQLHHHICRLLVNCPLYQGCTACVSRCEAAMAADAKAAELKPSGLNLSETWQASCNLQELCAQGLGRSSADLIKSRQSQAVLAGRLM